MLDVLKRAGAPTENAKKSEINWVHDTGVRIEAKKVDLEAFLHRDDPVSTACFTDPRGRKFSLIPKTQRVATTKASVQTEAAALW